MNERQPVNVVKGVILDSGEILSEKEMQLYEIKKQEDADLKSAQEREKNYSELYSGDAQEPRNNPFKMVELLTMSTPHYRCCKQKATDVIGLSWDIVPKDKDNQEKYASDIKKIKEFFESCCGEETFTEILRKAWMDYESVGWLNLEIVKENSDSPDGKDGEPKRIYHIPSYTVRKSKDAIRFYQVRDEKKVMFRKVNLDKEIYKKYIEEKELTNDSRLTISYHEIMEIMNYNPKSTYYGMPDVMPALGAIIGNLNARDYNLEFFDNHGVPRYAITVTGGTFSEPVKSLIKQYFQTGIKGKYHQTLILEVDSEDVKVEFEKLAVEVQDGSFKMYREDNRDEIILAHGVPPRWIGIAEAGNLGGTQEGRNQAENYLHAYIIPMNKVLSQRLTYNIIEKGFGINTVKIIFEIVDIKDQTAINKIICDQVDRGIISRNESRTEYLDMEAREEEMANELTVDNKTILLKNLSEQIQQVQKHQKEWMQGVFEKLREDLRHIAGKDSKGLFSKMFRRKK